jgi:hypothetical protein
MQKKHSTLALFAALLLIGLSQFACRTLVRPAPTPAPAYATVIVTATPAQPQILVITATPAPPGALPPSVNPAEAFSDQEISDGIQAALDLYAEAYNENQPELLEQAVDQENKPFRRIVRSRLDEFEKSSLRGQIHFQNTLLGIQRRDFGYVIAHFEDEDGWQANWPFRPVDGRWVLTEPTLEQIGEPVTTETEYFTFVTYPWADDVNPKIMEMLETARQQVAERLGKVPAEKARVRIVPVYAVDRFGSMGAIAWYSQGGDVDGRDLIHIYTPNSFAYSYYDPALGWDGTLQMTLTHEYTHMAHARAFNNAGRLADWMSEGLAEYISEAPGDVRYACHAYNTGVIIPILDESGALAKQDLMHMTSLEKDTGLAYAYSDGLVTFVTAKYGGLDGFWKLAKAIDDTGDFKKALKQAFGVEYRDFNQKWEAWLKGQC